MAESENIVAETAEKIFADLADAQTITHDKQGAWKAPLWQALTEAGLLLSWVPDDLGGSGASLAEGFSVLNVAGRHAIAVPLAETMLAGWLLTQGKIASPEGEMTVLPANLFGIPSVSQMVRDKLAHTHARKTLQASSPVRIHSDMGITKIGNHVSILPYDRRCVNLTLVS